LRQKVRIVEFAMTHKQAPNPSAALGEITHLTSRKAIGPSSFTLRNFSPARTTRAARAQRQI
jgi:hypothetical protein